MSEMIEYRAARIDVRKMVGGAMLLVPTDKGQVVIYLTEPAFENLARQTKQALPDATEQFVRPSGKPQT